MRTAALLAALGGLALPAHAAEVTDLPPQLRGDVRIAYGGTLFRAPLVEDGERVGGIRTSRHDLDVNLVFSPTRGVAVTLGLEVAPAIAVSFADDGKAMIYDPVADTGTYRGGPPLDTPPRFTGGGLTGLWVGAAVGPYGRWMAAAHPFSWRLDLGVRLPNAGGTFYEAADGSRGAAPGGTAFRLSGAFAVERDFAEPYVVARYQHEGRAVIDIGDPENGVTLVDATVQEPSSFDVRFGAELITLQDRDTGLRIAFDLYGLAGYRTRARRASGVFLPSVLDRSRQIEVTTSEHLLAGAGMGIVVHPAEALAIRVAGDLRAFTPYRVEHPYAVVYGPGTHAIGLNASIAGRWR